MPFWDDLLLDRLMMMPFLGGEAGEEGEGVMGSVGGSLVACAGEPGALVVDWPRGGDCA